MYKFLMLLVLNLGVCAELAAQSEISVNQLKKKLSHDGDYVVLDVRTPEEIEEGYIEGAMQLDYKADDFESKISNLDKSLTYYVYCAAGVRSQKASQIMVEQGFKSVYSVKGGMKEWKKKGLPVVKEE